jgi:DNA-binding transcriptional MerR regulator
MPGGRKLPHKREQALAALIESGSVEEAAAKCDVSERTLRTWLKEPAFKDEYRQARRRLLDDAVLALQQASRKAVEALVSQLDAAKPSDVIRAAAAILDRAFRGAEVLELAESLEDLQRQLDDIRKGSGSDPETDLGPPEDGGFAGSSPSGPGDDRW